MPQPADYARETMRCLASAMYFAHNYARVKDEARGEYIPFRLWPAQSDSLEIMASERFLVLLKARQLGMTTLVICYAVWLSLFRPGSVILLFSKTQQEAKDLLKRIRWTILRLPIWLRPREFAVDASQALELSNGSRFLAFASKSSGGDSYTASLVVVDEADLIPDLDLLLSGAKPTIDHGGQLFLLSRVDKAEPNSPFKRIYRAAVEGRNSYRHLFFSWRARPGRNDEWYAEQKREILERTGSLDDLYAQYPETPEQALAARSLDKRIPLAWLEACFEPLPLIPSNQTPFPGWNGLEVYRLPEAGKEYVVGSDVAAGNPNSDDSVSTVIDKMTYEECCVLCGKFEPVVLAGLTARLAEWYNGAPVLIERNNHGHKCIEHARKHKIFLLKGRDHKQGWFTDRLGKNMMYDTFTEIVRTCSSGLIAKFIHSQKTLDQLASIDVADLKCPDGFHDDRAVSIALAVQAASRIVKRAGLHIVTSTDPQAAPEVQGVRRLYSGVRFIPMYNSYEAVIDHAGQRVSFGDWQEEAWAAHCVNVACEMLGLERPNFVKDPIDPATAEEIAAKVAKTLTERRLLAPAEAQPAK